jgi:hypothetical protein
MDDSVLTLNDEGPIESSPTVDFTDSLVLPDTDPEKANNIEGENVEEKPEEKEEAEQPPETNGEATRLDKEPRFKEVIQQKNTLKAERDSYKTRLEETQARLAAIEAEKEKVADAKDLMSLSQEEIHEAFDEDPKNFLADFARSIEKRMLEKQSEFTTVEQNALLQDRVNATFENFEKHNDGFRAMWDSGELKSFMDENPGHNAISAFHELTFEKRVQAAKEEAAKEAEKKVLANLKAKGNAKSLESGPTASRPSGVDDELINPEKYGGLTKVLTDRFIKRQAAG